MRECRDDEWRRERDRKREGEGGRGRVGGGRKRKFFESSPIYMPNEARRELIAGVMPSDWPCSDWEGLRSQGRAERAHV